MSAAHENKQLLHLVFGGELKTLDGNEFRDIDKLDIVGIYPDYKSAEAAWRAKAQETCAFRRRSPAGRMVRYQETGGEGVRLTGVRTRSDAFATTAKIG